MKRPPNPPVEAAPDPDIPAPESDGPDRAIELLSQVRSGAIPGRMLAPDARQSLVVLLAADGVSGPEIAQLLQVSDRTIERDRRAIRAAAAVTKDPRLVSEMVGRLMAEAELAVQRIRRTTRERDVDPNIKVEGEHRCFQIIKDLTHSLQSLGYLPTATQRIEADLTHHPAEIPDAEELLAELERLKQLSPESDVLDGLGASLQRAQLASAIASLREGGEAAPEDGEETGDAAEEASGESEEDAVDESETDSNPEEGEAQEDGDAPST